VPAFTTPIPKFPGSGVSVAAVDAAEISAITVFAELDEAQRSCVAGACRELEVDAGTTLTAEGEFGYAMFAVTSGTADVFKNGEHVRTLGRGDVFGEIAVLSSGRRTATVTSTSSMRLVSVFKRDLWRFADANPGFDDALRQATIRS
jgi:CRP-like cAMP-binding protein